ncbi:MAG: hypothetical protein ABI629_14400 [bacterium]
MTTSNHASDLGQSGDVHSRPLRRVGLELFAVSFLILFQELTLIRWLPAQVRVLAYFPNLILLSAFLGLGLGCLRAGKRSLLWLWPTTLLILALSGLAMSNIIFTQNSTSEHLWLLYYDLPADAPIIGDVRSPIVLCFLLSALSFVALGQLVALRLREFRAQGVALWGYCCDILGSLTGVIAFAAAGFARTAPPLWFAVCLVAALPFFATRRRSLLLYGLAAAALLAIAARADRADYYSPYYAISTRHEANAPGVQILTNGSLHQYMIGLDRDGLVVDEPHYQVRQGYHLPYRLLARPPRNVLVLGAGTGNDVAVALDEGAEHVDAVEIDPVILDIGSRHPNRPYASDKVRQINTDARAFLNETTEKYDLIVFGTLDSMTRLSALSSVRLDNFVYTEEGLAAAQAHLAPDGGLVMYFMVRADFIDARLAGMVTQRFDLPPAVDRTYYYMFNRIYMTGPAFAHVQAERRAADRAEVQRMLSVEELPSDDWPYLYLSARSVDGFYVSLIAVFAAIAVASVVLVSRDMRRSLSGGAVDAEMFLFGLAFLLLETKAVTTMSLLWGATWLTSAVVFGAILAMVLLATALTQLRPLPWSVCMGGLIATLLIAYVVPVHTMLRMDGVARLGVSIAFVGTPIFFAAACFALSFRDRASADIAFGWNLLGAVAGGLVEFVSMATGIRALYLLALVAYLGVVLLRLRATAEVSHAAVAADPA